MEELTLEELICQDQKNKPEIQQRNFIKKPIQKNNNLNNNNSGNKQQRYQNQKQKNPNNLNRRYNNDLKGNNGYNDNDNQFSDKYDRHYNGNDKGRYRDEEKDKNFEGDQSRNPRGVRQLQVKKSTNNVVVIRYFELSLALEEIFNFGKQTGDVEKVSAETVYIGQQIKVQATITFCKDSDASKFKEDFSGAELDGNYLQIDFLN